MLNLGSSSANANCVFHPGAYTYSIKPALNRVAPYNGLIGRSLRKGSGVTPSCRSRP